MNDYSQIRLLSGELGSSSGNNGNSGLGTSGGNLGNGITISSNSNNNSNTSGNGNFSGRVLLVSKDERLYALKEYHIESEAQCNRFDAELRLLHSLRHPCVLSIEAVFYDRNKAFIQMPFYDGYALKQWLTVCRPPPLYSSSFFLTIFFSL